ncbi:MAG: hypothetical protein EXR53_06475, partial [Dehalococcoidia bacterium]|nr:hypothetical protein [Dehalococcoidia bacterium]
MTSNATVSPAIIWEKAEQLMKPGQLASKQAVGLVDNTFAFEVYHSAFAERVRKMREFFWNSPATPFPHDEEGEKERRLWIQNLNWRIKGMAPEQGAEQSEHFDGDLQRMSSDYALPRWAVERYLFFGIVPDAPPLRAVLHQSSSGPYAIEIRVFSSSVTGDQLKHFYDNLKARQQLPQLYYDRVPADGTAKPAVEQLMKPGQLASKQAVGLVDNTFAFEV